ncbi:AbrB family transcriptional regulator [Nitriliruptor alkaliphilus]|uniref:AbrB family transcriptional regulator n=1 Tax=Nitriliruptor alkaliphilus TaxID=427918 RepID=UPI000696582D|nr:AbrB family transcriptional regulator [Nitriliruptor alkaliphilus]
MTLLTTVAAAVAGAALFEAARVPAGALVGAMVAVAVVNLAGTATSELPSWARFAAFAAIGWAIGHGLDRTAVRAVRDHVGVIVATVLVLLVVGAVIAVVLVRLSLTDPATAFLATSPGGLSQMTALSVAAGADATLVTTLHLVRVVVVVAVTPWIVRLLPAGGG